MGVHILFEGDSGVIAAIEFERGVTGAGILGIVVNLCQLSQLIS